MTILYRNAPKKWDVLGMMVIVHSCRSSSLCAHYFSRFDTVNPELLDMTKVVSEDATGRAFRAIAVNRH
jgi:hypothetical protein